jgi:hypothetical protein
MFLSVMKRKFCSAAIHADMKPSCDDAQSQKVLTLIDQWLKKAEHVQVYP